MKISPRKWRKHPLLKGKFHPDYPDDLQVLVHDGQPRITGKVPELMWVTVTRVEGNVFYGRVINSPHALETVKLNDTICFIVPKGEGYPPLHVTEQYLQERRDWVIHPCDECGNTELFELPSAIVKRVAPDPPEGGKCMMFTTWCGMCGGVHVVKSVDKPPGAEK